MPTQMPTPAPAAPAAQTQDFTPSRFNGALMPQNAPAEPTAPATATLTTASPQAADASHSNGRQEPAVSIEWLGPPSVKVGQPADYSIVVRNTCSIAVHQVLLRVRLAGGVTAMSTEPKVNSDEGVLALEVGTLQPRQEKTLQLRLQSKNSGEAVAQAWVTFTGAASLRIRVNEPKLVVKASVPERVTIGEPATFTLSVSNPGDGVAEQVKLKYELSDGLSHPGGPRMMYDLGNLNPGEARTVQVICLTKTAGEQVCQAAAVAEGLNASERAATVVSVPKLEIEAKGPKLRYLDRKATYTFKVTNTGDAPAVNVALADGVPPGFKFVSADAGGRFDFATSTVSWFVGEIPPGQSREVNMDVLCVSAGDFLHKVTAQAARGLMAESQVLTRVEGVSAILLEVVDTEDPVEVNGETVYEIRITNTGSKTETDLKLACTIPTDKMQFKTATGPSAFKVEGGEVVFDALPKLAPRADALYRVTVKCTAPGVAHFKARITSTVLTEPVTKEEATRIYVD
jgi:uncharacterized repeat protein (TIGR01451 family)